MHFVKSALNVRFDGFCVLTTDLLGLSVRACDHTASATNVRITNYPRSARRRSATSTARLRSCPVRTLRRLHPTWRRERTLEERNPIRPPCVEKCVCTASDVSVIIISNLCIQDRDNVNERNESLWM